MGKFDGILLCTDLDDTLLTTDKRVSDENSKAIEYFKSEGGLFTFATGRVPQGAKLMLNYVHPNAPMVCFNGAAIYDFNDEKLLWASTLDKGALKCVEYIDKMFDFEDLPDTFLDYHDIKEDWVKVLFMVEENEIQQIRDAIANSPFVNDYEFVQSSPWYYELLPKNASKGEGLMHLADLMNVDRSNTIGIGDNENDLALVKMANVGVAVSNAVDEVKEVADFITVDNNSSAVAAVIYALDDEEIKFE